MSIIDQLMSEQGGEIISQLVASAGLDTSQAERFLPAAAGKLMEAIGGGGIDLGSLLGGGDESSLLEKVDVGALASETGVEPSSAGSGLQVLIPLVTKFLGEKSGGAEGVLSMLGGADGDGDGETLGAVGKLAGKLFGR